MSRRAACGYKPFSATVVLGMALLLIAIGADRAVAEAKDGEQPNGLRIGLSGVVFHDVPEATAKQAREFLALLVETQTGLRGETIIEENIEKLAEHLTQGKLDFAVFVGFEFAWAREQHSKLRPLVIAVNQERQLCAHVIVRQDSPATRLTDLQAKSFGLPRGSRPHCRLFLERQCQASGKIPALFFAQVTKPPTGEDALDDVVDGVVQATVVDGFCLDCYKRRKPGRFAKLKELSKSEAFPAPVVAYHSGALDEATLRRFRDGLLQANQNDDGRRLLNLWKLTGFEKVPEDYGQTLAAIAKAYPAAKGGKK